MKNLFLLGWNDEYLDMRIITGPFSKEKKAKVIKDELIQMIMKNYNLENEASAIQCFNMSCGTDESVSLYENGATVVYGSGYEDRIQVVEFNQDFKLEINTPAGKIVSKITPDEEYLGISTFVNKPGEPGTITEYDPLRKCIVTRIYKDNDTDEEPDVIEYNE